MPEFRLPAFQRARLVSRRAAPWLLAGWATVTSVRADAAPDDRVEIRGTTYTNLRAQVGDPDPGAGPAVAARRIALRAAETGFVVDATYELTADAPGWLTGVLAGPGFEIEAADLGGRAAPILRTPLGTLLTAWIEGPTTLQLRGFVATESDAISLTTLPATRGRLTIDDPKRRLRLSADDGASLVGLALVGNEVWGGAATLPLRLVDPADTKGDKGPLVVGHAAIGLTVGDGELTGRARVRWDVRRGSVARLGLRTTGVGDDLQLQGPGVESWARDGDAIAIALAGEVTDRVEVELSWSIATPARAEASVAVPQIEPTGVFRTDATLQLARDDEIEVVPRVEAWQAIAASELPAWGEGLVTGRPTAAFAAAPAGAGGSLDLLRFEPVPGPPTVVDVAAYTIATTEAGRVLLKARYDVRNERASHLSIEPPEGMRIIGARVSTETATPARDEAGAWRIPLTRSLETVGGLLSFPVEVVMLGEARAWKRRERREMPLPTLDAPIAASRTTLYLPPGYRSRLDPGDATCVDAFTEGEGITYGLAVAADDDQVAEAEALFEDAVQAYRDNDFERAQSRLDELSAMGAKNDNVDNLQGNLTLVTGEEDDDRNAPSTGKSADVALARRIKEQAKARAAEDVRRQQRLAEQAQSLRIAGDYDEAEAKLDEAIEIGDKLEALEAEESVEQQARNVQIASSLEVVKTKKKAGKRRRRFGSSRRGGAPTSASTPTETLAKETSGSEGAVAGDPIALGGADGGGAQGPMSEEPPPPPVRPAPDVTVIDEPAANANTDDAPEAAAGPPVAGTTAAETRYAYEDEVDDGDDAQAIVVSRRAPRFRVFERRRKARQRQRDDSRAAQSVAVYDFEDDDLDGEILRPEGADIAARARARYSGDPLPDPDPKPEAPPPVERLPAPVATASALSVVVPAVGEELRYQQLLIEAGQTQTIRIDARRHRRPARSSGRFRRVR